MGVTLTVSSLATGKAMNPMRGLSPFIVTREKEPRRYWASVTMNLFLIVLGRVFLRAAVSN